MIFEVPAIAQVRSSLVPTSAFLLHSAVFPQFLGCGQRSKGANQTLCDRFAVSLKPSPGYYSFRYISRMVIYFRKTLPIEP